MKLSQGFLEGVAHENWHANHHPDSEVLEDLGYASADTLAETIKTTLERQAAGEDFSVMSLAKELRAQELMAQYPEEEIKIARRPKVIPRGRTRGEDGVVHVHRATLSRRALLLADEPPAHEKKP